MAEKIVRPILTYADECHHATAETYKKIIGYFEPEFLLGLTATPERLDNQDVFELFDHIVPYRNLPQAPDGMTADCRSLVSKAAGAAFEIRP